MSPQRTDRRLAARIAKRAVPARYRPEVFGALGSVLYSGNGAECPCCGRSFRAFRLRQRVCPRCGSLGRHRLLWLFLERHPEMLRDAGDLLHFAPEYCLRRLLSRRPGLHYVTADRDSPLADDRVNIETLPYADGSFGAILCSHVLEHVNDDRRAMSEMARVLKPGGWAIVMTPVEPDRDSTLEDPSVTDPGERLRLFGQEDHVRIYGADLARRLRKAGFEVSVERLVYALPREIVQRMRLHEEGDDELYLCTKPTDRAPARD